MTGSLLRWRLAIVVGTAQRIQLSLNSIKNSIDAHTHFNDCLLRSLKDLLDLVEYLLVVRLGQIDNVIVHLLNQRVHPLALYDNQIDDVTSPAFSFLRKPLLEPTFNLLRDPMIEPFDQIHSRVKAFLDFVHRSDLPSPTSCKNCSNKVEPGTQSGILTDNPHWTSRDDRSTIQCALPRRQK